MSIEVAGSVFRFEKRRTEATLTLSSGRTMRGCFFVAGGSARHVGPERVADLLNSETGVFPFEIQDEASVRTVLYNRAHVVSVTLSEDEAKRDPGYGLATPRVVSLVLSNGHRITGVVRVYRPVGLDRLSDWARQPETFRYVEAGDLTLIVNTAHIVEVTEVSEA